MLSKIILLLITFYVKCNKGLIFLSIKPLIVIHYSTNGCSDNHNDEFRTFFFIKIDISVYILNIQKKK